MIQLPSGVHRSLPFSYETTKEIKFLLSRELRADARRIKGRERETFVAQSTIYFEFYSAISHQP